MEDASSSLAQTESFFGWRQTWREMSQLEGFGMQNVTHTHLVMAATPRDHPKTSVEHGATLEHETEPTRNPFCEDDVFFTLLGHSMMAKNVKTGQSFLLGVFLSIPLRALVSTSCKRSS